MLKPVHCGWHHFLGWEPSSIERKKQSECSHLSFSYVSLKMQCFLSLPSLCTFYHNAKQIQSLSSSKPFIINFLFSDYFYDANICNKKNVTFLKRKWRKSEPWGKGNYWGARRTGGEETNWDVLHARRT